jgi:hypothetical protein
MAEISIIDIRQGPVGPAGPAANVTQANIEAAITDKPGFREEIGTVATDGTGAEAGAFRDAIGSQEWVNVVSDHGATGDGKSRTDAAMTAGSAALTSAGAAFVAGDVGKKVRVVGAGAAGVDLISTISARISGTQVTLADNAGTTVSSKWFDWGTDNTPPFRAALDTGKNVYIPQSVGKYLLFGDVPIEHAQDKTDAIGLGGQKIMGAGFTKTMIFQCVDSSDIFRVPASASNVEFYDFMLEYANANTATGIGIRAQGPLNILWRVQRVYFVCMAQGFKGPMVDLLMEDISCSSCVIGIQWEASPGIGVNCNILRHAGLVNQVPGGRGPAVPMTGLLVDGGYGLLIESIDTGNQNMVSSIRLAGNSAGVIRGISSETYPMSGQVVSVINAANCGISRWTVENCNLHGFGAMAATDWPIIKGRFLQLTTINVASPGNWINGGIRVDSSGDMLAHPLAHYGDHLKVDLYSTATSAILASYWASPFGNMGLAAYPLAGTANHGRFFTELELGAQDDQIYHITQRGGSGLFARDNLLQYASDVRSGRFANIGFQQIDNSTITATANNHYLTFTPSRVIDGDDATTWVHNGSVAGGTSFLKLDLGAGKASRVGLIRYRGAAASVPRMTVTVSGSNDDSAYTEIGRFALRTTDDDITAFLNGAIAYRYYRLNFTTTDTTWLSVSTVSLFRPITSGLIVGTETPTYANDAAADADLNLPSGAYYLITGTRTLYRKP